MVSWWGHWASAGCVCHFYMDRRKPWVWPVKHFPTWLLVFLRGTWSAYCWFFRNQESFQWLHCLFHRGGVMQIHCSLGRGLDVGQPAPTSHLNSELPVSQASTASPHISSKVSVSPPISVKEALESSWSSFFILASTLISCLAGGSH